MLIYKKYWWKLLCIFCLVYTFIGGFLFEVPARAILNETIRNLHFHVPMWFTMIVLQATSIFYSIRFLKYKSLKDDYFAHNYVATSIGFGILGFLTGMLWVKVTWDSNPSFLTFDSELIYRDPKLKGSIIALLIYLPFLLLRQFIPEKEQRASISAVYNIFAFTMGIVLLFIVPRMQDSMHPGNGGNPAFSQYDLDSNLRKVFYPACIGWITLGIWIASLKYRIDIIKAKKNEELD